LNQQTQSFQEKVVGNISGAIGRQFEKEANKQINAEVNRQKEGLFGSGGNQPKPEQARKQRAGFGLFG